MATAVFRRLLVPTDGSEASFAAAELAVRLALNQHAEVVAIYVLDDELVSRSTTLTGDTQKEVRERLMIEGRGYLDQIERTATSQGLNIRREVREGDPHKVIVGLADEIDADLIVMGHAGRRGPRRVLVGSTAERVVRFAHCPVLIEKA